MWLQHAGFDLEFLQRIRERYRQREIVVRILIDGAVQLVRHGIALPARYRDNDGRIIPHRVDRTVAGRTCHARKEHQLDRIAPVQGHLGDSLVVYHLADARRTGLHLSDVGLHCDLFADRPNLQRDIDSKIAIHLQHDACLDVRGETRFGPLQHVRA